MALNKKEEFAGMDIDLAELAKALSHPARIAILRVLAERQSCICGEIVEVMPLAQATVSQHLKELKNAGLIKGEIEGKKSCYCINWDKMAVLVGLFGDFFQQLQQYQPNQTCC